MFLQLIKNVVFSRFFGRKTPRQKGMNLRVGQTWMLVDKSISKDTDNIFFTIKKIKEDEQIVIYVTNYSNIEMTESMVFILDNKDMILSSNTC